MKVTPFRLQVLQAVALLLSDGREELGLAAIWRTIADQHLRPNRLHAALDALVEGGLLIRRPVFPRLIVALTPAGQAALDAATEPARP
ncbi:MAG: hypothetical protein HYU66_19765 [Armatimonadetes bacterium]|nr:hypothetical protein [Armatimonadota bacterium]